MKAATECDPKAGRISCPDALIHLDLGIAGHDVGPDRRVCRAPGQANYAAVCSFHSEGEATGDQLDSV